MTNPSEISASPADAGSRPLEKSFRRAVFRYFLLLALLITAPAIPGRFYLDDAWFIQNNKAVHSLKNIPRFFYDQSTNAAENRDYPRVFRPLLYITFTWDYVLFDAVGRIFGQKRGGTFAGGYRLENIVYHALAAYVLFLLFLTILRRNRASWLGDAATVEGEANGVGAPEAKRSAPELEIWVALFAAAFFLLHPLNTEGVSYVSTRSECLAALFYFLTVYLHITAYHPQTKKIDQRRLALSLGAAALGFMTKETPITIPGTLLAYHLLVEREDGKLRSWPALARQNWPMIALCVFYVGLRHVILGKVKLTQNPHETSAYILTQLKVIWIYMRMVFWPSDQTIIHQMREQPFSIWSVASLVGLALIAVLLLRWKNRVAAFGGALFFIALSPTTSFIVLRVLMNEHRLYISMAGASLLIAAFFGALLYRRREALDLKKAAYLAAAALFFYGSWAAARSYDYSEPLKFWGSTVRATPDYFKAHYMYARTLAKERRYDEAEEHYQKCLELHQSYSGCRLGYAQLLNLLGRYKEAAEALEGIKGGGDRAPEIFCELAGAYKNLSAQENDPRRKHELAAKQKGAIKKALKARLSRYRRAKAKSALSSNEEELKITACPRP
jgi:tetratricopeptide (TPR) repeat protein